MHLLHIALGSLLSISDSLRDDFLYWVPFFFGQCLFILKRTALAIRSPLNAVRSRRQYLFLNWDILAIRTALEFALVYIPYRHIPIDTLTAGFSWHMPFHIPQDSAVLSFLLGYMSDSTTDWIAMQDTIFKIPIPSWIKETIPHLPQVQVMVATLEVKEDTRA